MEIKLNIEEIINLEAELCGLNGLQGERVVKGLLDYTMPIKQRYDITKVFKQCSVIRENFKSLEQGLIFTHRDNQEDDVKENAEIKSPDIKDGKEVPGTRTDNFTVFETERKELLKTEETIDFPKNLTLGSLEKVESQERLETLFKCFDLIEEQSR